MQEFGEQMLKLVELNDLDWNMTEGILDDIDFDYDVKFHLYSWVGSVSMRN